MSLRLWKNKHWYFFSGYQLDGWRGGLDHLKSKLYKSGRNKKCRECRSQSVSVLPRCDLCGSETSIIIQNLTPTPSTDSSRQLWNNIVWTQILGTSMGPGCISRIGVSDPILWIVQFIENWVTSHWLTFINKAQRLATSWHPASCLVILDAKKKWLIQANQRPAKMHWASSTANNNNYLLR